MRRVLWALILAPPLLLWLVLSVLTLTHVPHDVHTGEAFIDAYALVFVAQGGLKLTERYPAKHLRAKEQWRALEKQFSNDPRFWWVCYKLRNDSTGETDLPRESYLQEARRRGIANLPILLDLYASVYASYEHKIEYHPNFSQIASNSSSHSRPTLNELSNILHARQKAIDQLHDDSLDVILQEMRDYSPMHPLPVYLQAVLAGERLQYDHAYQLLKRGNYIAAKQWHNGSALSDMYTPIIARKLTTSDALLAKYISNFTYIEFPGRAGTLEWDTEVLAYDSLKANRLDICNEVYRMACYDAISSGYNSKLTRLGLHACLEIQKEVARQPLIATDPGKAAALAELHTKLITAYRYWLLKGASSKNYTQRQVQLLQYESSFESEIEELIDSASRGYYTSANQVLGISPDPLFKSYLLEKPGPGVYKAEMDKMFAELLRFDYTTCSFHDSPAAPAR